MNSSGVTESGESEKVLLLMESGVRLHTTAYARYAFIIWIFCGKNTGIQIDVFEVYEDVYNQIYYFLLAVTKRILRLVLL